MINYYFWVISAAIFARVTFVYGYNEERILNGTITPPDLFQFTVRVFVGGRCTGTVISNRHVLTAAHCFHLKNDSTEYERYQALNRNVSIQIRNGTEKIMFKTDPLILSIYLPITWQSRGSDIAVVEFPEGTDFGVEPVKLGKDYLEKEGDEGYIAGYGHCNCKDGGLLRHVKVSIVDDCFGTFRVCAGNITHRTLSGDSGGPMLINRNDQWYNIGVCIGSGSKYGLRTRVSAYCNFIEEVTKNEAKCESIYPERNIENPMPLKIFEPIYKDQSTSSELFKFVVPLYNFYYRLGCTATVISKRHLLTSAYCVYQDWNKSINKKIQITEHSSYKSVYGKLFPDFRAVHSNLLNPMNATAYFPSNYVWPRENNIAVIEFPDGTDFGVERVSLPDDYTLTYLDNSTYISVGYGKCSINDLTKKAPPKLKHSRMFFFNEFFSDKHLENPIEELLQDEGGPTLIERNGKFYQIGVHIRKGAKEGRRTFVTHYCNFIEEVTKNEVKCESIAPIHETPPESTTTRTTITNSLPLDQDTTPTSNEKPLHYPESTPSSVSQNLDKASSNPIIAQQLSNNTNASTNLFKMVLFIIAFLTRFYFY